MITSAAYEHEPEIEFDSRKAAANLRKHGVNFDDAISVFAGDPSAYCDFDGEHSENDRRFFTIGVSNRGKLLYIVHNESESGTIRLISARNANSRERSLYEESDKDL